MPYSTTLFKEEIKQHIIKHIDSRMKILDVGAGCGTYAHLLRAHFPRLDAIEIYQPNIQKFGLDKLYHEVFLGNVLDFDFNENQYGYVIMGDVIEHMSVEDAKRLITKLDKLGVLMMIGVPYMYEQGSCEGNDYEIHLQPTLTKELFLSLYPEMFFLMGDDSYGYFTNYVI